MHLCNSVWIVQSYIFGSCLGARAIYRGYWNPVSTGPTSTWLNFYPSWCHSGRTLQVVHYLRRRNMWETLVIQNWNPLMVAFSTDPFLGKSMIFHLLNTEHWIFPRFSRIKFLPFSLNKIYALHTCFYLFWLKVLMAP